MDGGRYFDELLPLLEANRQHTAEELQRIVLSLFKLDMGVQAVPHVIRLATMQEQAGQTEAALQTLQQGINHDPQSAQLFTHAGLFQQRQGRLADARRCLERAISLDPTQTSLYGLLGVLLQDMNEPAQSERVLKKALRRQPDNPQTWLNLGTAQMRLHHVNDAEHSYVSALRLDPNYIHARANLGMCQLWQGKAHEGFANYEARYNMPPEQLRVKPPTFPVPRWQGEDLSGKRVLVWPEQGLGDQIMCAAWLSQLRQQCGVKQLVLACARPLLPIFGRLQGPHMLVDVYDAMPLCDVWLGAMSVPYALLRQVGRINPVSAWLTPQMQYLPQVLQHRSAKLRVGLCWKGSAAYPGDAQRSFTLDTYSALLTLPDVEFVSLLPDTRQAFLDWGGAAALDIGHEIDSASPAFEETAAIMQVCDLIITSDTSIAHLAVALGRPTWLMLQFNGEWRWSIHPAKASGSLQIMKQPLQGDWAGLMQSVQNRLKTLVKK
jgi:Flp pilus assembly protein TadD